MYVLRYAYCTLFIPILVSARLSQELPPNKGVLWSRQSLAPAVYFKSYHAYDDISRFLDSLATTYPLHAETFTLGTSHQGRMIPGLHIWGSQKGRPAAIFSANTKGREWISNAVTQYLANQLLNTTSPFLERNDIYIIPVVNVDGYIYTFTTDRTWAKTRTPYGLCYGVNIDRNFDDHWGEVGASNNPCSETYVGAKAASEVETQALAKLASDLVSTSGVNLFVDFQAYRQQLLSPYGYNKTPPPNFQTQEQLLDGWAAALLPPHGRTYITGTIANTDHLQSGNAVDYMFEKLGIQNSFQVRLPDKGRYGYVLPASQIQGVCEEQWAGLQYLLTELGIMGAVTV